MFLEVKNHRISFIYDSEKIYERPRGLITSLLFLRFQRLEAGAFLDSDAKAQVFGLLSSGIGKT